MHTGAGLGRVGGMSPAALAVLQRTVGNRALAQLVADERHEHGPGCGHSGGTAVQRAPEVDAVLRSGGRPLDAPLRQEMEARLDADFGDVRLHDDSAARRSATQLGARAYTSGSHVVIGEGGGDKHTLAHELTHVIQQRSGPVAGADTGDGLRVSDPGDAFERAAEANAARAMSGPVPVQRSADAGEGAAHASEQGGSGRRRQVQRVAYNTNAVPQGSFIHPVVDALGRTTSIEMMSDGSLNGSPPAIDPTGYTYIRQLSLTNFWIRFHLINMQAGGPGTMNNLVPASKRDNSQYEASVESALKKELTSVATANAALAGNAPRHYVYFGVDVDYGTANAQTSAYQQSFAPHFVRSLTINFKRYDPTAGAWQVLAAAHPFPFTDPQPTDFGQALAAATMTLPDLIQATSNRKWNVDDVVFLQSLATGGTRNAEFQQEVNQAGALGATESVIHAFSQMRFRARGAVTFAERIDNDRQLATLANLIGTGRITT
ncbi:eCIS core domain-containing protein [Streptomyces sp. NPDC002156]